MCKIEKRFGTVLPTPQSVSLVTKIIKYLLTTKMTNCVTIFINKYKDSVHSLAVVC